MEAMKKWFAMKFKPDLSGFNPAVNEYYEHQVYHFFKTFFTSKMLKNKTVLDIGCGPGFYVFQCAKRGAHALGIDWCKYLIDKANKYKREHRTKNTRFIHADVLDILPGLEAKSYDLIFAIDTIATIDQDRKKHDVSCAATTFKQIKRVLKDDGKIYVIEAHPCFHEGKMLPASITYDLVNGEYYSGTEDKCLFLRRPYKIKDMRPGEHVHWFTLSEMTNAFYRNGLAVTRIMEPEPNPILKNENPDSYEYFSKYCGMIVYEVQKLLST